MQSHQVHGNCLLVVSGRLDVGQHRVQESIHLQGFLALGLVMGRPPETLLGCWAGQPSAGLGLLVPSWTFLRSGVGTGRICGRLRDVLCDRSKLEGSKLEEVLKIVRKDRREDLASAGRWDDVQQSGAHIYDLVCQRSTPRTPRTPRGWSVVSA